MSFFAFNLTASHTDPHYIGSVVGVDNRRVTVDVPGDRLDQVSVGQLAVFPLIDRDQWLVGLVDRLVCGAPGFLLPADERGGGNGQAAADAAARTPQGNVASISLVGTIKSRKTADGNTTNSFSRSLVAAPDVRSPGFAMRAQALTTFMNLLVEASATDNALVLGQYTLDPTATAFLDGDKFFQRHAALLGSTGSGKSWTVATILERAAQLPAASVVVFDLHGEYSKLSYARQLRVPGPDELQTADPNLLFLPHWLMTAEELAATFVDNSEATAHDQILVLQREIEQAKRAFLQQYNKTEVLKAFTVDSPVPFPLDTVANHLDILNTKVVQDYRGSKQGEFYGMFGRLLVRMRTRRTDRRYGFMFQTPDQLQTYEAFALLARQLLDFKPPRAKVRVIDFSEVPADVLPIMLGIVARLIYYLQFWMPKELRHPVAMVCEEAHLYLPNKCANANEERALACFQKIAKEGRKYGVSMVVVSQRPSDVDTTILSQCNNVLAMRLANTMDQVVIQRMMPDCLGALLEMLPILDTGEVLVVGDAVLLPSRVRVLTPKEKPISATVDFWTEWNRVDRSPDWQLAAENMRRQRRLSQ
ncbi:MAG: ATP-binding protein [bacterium]